MRGIERKLCLRSLISQCVLCLISTILSACAPLSWRSEARLFSHLGDWNRALDRYEGSLLSGDATPSVYEGASLSLDALIEKNLRLVQTSERGHVPLMESCSELIALEQLSPSVLDRLGMSDHPPLSSPLKVHELSRELLRIEESSSCPLNGQWLHDWRLASRLEQELMNLGSSAQQIDELELLNSLLERLITLSPPHSALSGLQQAIVSRRDDFWHQKSLDALTSHQWALAHFFTRLSTAQPRSHLRPSIPLLKELVREELLGLIDRLSTPLISSKAQSVPKFILSYLESAEAQIQSNSDQSAWEALFGEIRPHQMAEVSFSEGDLHCTNESIKTSREVRYQEELTQVTSPKYMSALKRVEESQAKYEEALAEREELERSILIAQAELSATENELKSHQERAQRHQPHLSRLLHHRDTELLSLSTLRELLNDGPPSYELLERLKNAELLVKERVETIESAQIEQEIIQSALEDYLSRHQKMREEVQRLSGYLVKTIHLVSDAEKLLDDREALLAETPKLIESSAQSIFRYPAFEERFTCSLTLNAQLNPFSQSDDDKHKMTPEQWSANETLTHTLITHRAYPRYKVLAVKSAKQKIYKTLKDELRKRVARRAYQWLTERRTSLLSSYGLALYKEKGKQLSDEALALLTRLSPEHFLGPLLNRLQESLSLRAPLLELSSLTTL